MKLRFFLAAALCGLFVIVSPAHSQPDQIYGDNAVRYQGTGTNDNDLLFTTSGTVAYDACMLMSITGAVDVEGTIDGSNWTTAPLSLQDLGATALDPVIVTVADRMYAVVGKYLALRVRQNGATAASASLLCWKR